VVLGIVSLDFYFEHAISILHFFFAALTCSDFSFSGAELNKSKSVYLLDNCPHDWLFPRCTAVVPTKFFLVESKVGLNYK
jgi:hypothetical protein